MKKTKRLSQILSTIAFVLLILLLIIRTITSSGQIVTLADNAFLVSTLPFILGLAFIFAENKVLEKIGYSLLMVTSLTYFAFIFIGDVIGLIFGILIFGLLLVSVLTYFVRAVLVFFGYAKTEVYLSENALAASLKRIKDLKEKQVITEVHYATLKAKFLDKELTGVDKADLDQRVVLLEKGLVEISDVL